MPIQRPKAHAAPAAATVNFGAMNFYSGGFTLPEGDYALEFGVQMSVPGQNSNAKQRLGVMVVAHPLNGGEPMEQFFSMGSKADQSFAPDPDTGKGLVSIPGAAGGTLNNKTNWALFLKSLYDSGLPEGVFVNDFTTIDGIHVHTALVPEPEDRKGFGAQTGEAAQEQRQGSGMIPVVTEIKEDGKPWEGSGGIPDGTKAPVAKVAGKITPKIAPKAAVKAAPVEEVGADEGVLQAAANGMADVLGKLAAGKTISSLQLRTGSFQAVSKAEGAEMAQAVQNDVFGNADVLASVLGQLGFSITSGVVKQA